MTANTVRELSSTHTALKLILSTILAGAAGDVYAQAQGFEEITVTATRRVQSVQDVPYNISVLSGQQLESASVDGLVELTSQIPGLAYANFGSRSASVNNQLILRGINVSSQGTLMLSFQLLCQPAYPPT